MKIAELKERFSKAEGVENFTKLWVETVREIIAQKSAAITLSKMLILASQFVPKRRNSIKSWAESVIGRELGSAMENGYKSYVVARTIVAWNSGSEPWQIDEETFDSLGIDDFILCSAIINRTDGHDCRLRYLERLAAILRSKKAEGCTKPRLVALRDEVKAEFLKS